MNSLSRLKNLFSQTAYLLKGLIGFGAVITIHELGRLFACKLFGVSVPFFSLGFGPTIARLIIGNTIFDIGIIPIGGYAFIDQTELALQSHVSQITILCSGIIANLLAGFVIYKYLGKTVHEYRRAFYNVTPIALYRKAYECQEAIRTIGIIPLLHDSIHKGIVTFLPTFATLNIFFACINILPLPFLDGLKIMRVIVQSFAQ